jgi:hypothetical protein
VVAEVIMEATTAVEVSVEEASEVAQVASEVVLVDLAV